MPTRREIKEEKTFIPSVSSVVPNLFQVTVPPTERCSAQSTPEVPPRVHFTSSPMVSGVYRPSTPRGPSTPGWESLLVYLLGQLHQSDTTRVRLINNILQFSP